MFEAALVGHLVGDFLFQNDIQARNKASNSWWCLLHVVLYTFAVLLFTGYWHWLFAVIVAVPHFCIDRWKLPRKVMTLCGQEQFATGPMAPWSIVVVDQVWHIVCLFLTVQFL